MILMKQERMGWIFQTQSANQFFTRGNISIVSVERVRSSRKPPETVRNSLRLFDWRVLWGESGGEWVRGEAKNGGRRSSKDQRRDRS